MGGRAQLAKVGSLKARHKQASGTSPLLPEGGLLAGMGPPWCGLEVGPWGQVMNQIRKVVEGMHWRMHAEPALSIGSHRVTMHYKNYLSLVLTKTRYRTDSFDFSHNVTAFIKSNVIQSRQAFHGKLSLQLAVFD